MQKLSKREKNLVIVCGVFLILVVVFLMLPSGRSGANVHLLPTQEARRRLRVDQAKLQSLDQQQSDLTSHLTQMAYSKSPQALIPMVVRNLQLIANRAGVHLRETRPLRPRALPSGLGTRVPVEVRLRAAFQPDVIKFLYYVEDPANRMVLDRLDVTSAEARFKSVDVSAVITVFTQAVTSDTDSSGDGGTSDGSDSTDQG